jgi:DNA modification methylase
MVFFDWRFPKMKPYFSKGAITIYHGDTLSTLASIKPQNIAALVSDPPYSSGNLPESMKQKAPPRLKGRQWAGKVMETDQLSTLGFLYLIREVVVATRSGMNAGASALLFIDWRNWGNLTGAVESAGLRVNNMIVWDKVHFGMGNGFRNQHELVLWASKGTPRVCSRSVPNVIQCKKDPTTLHQSPKPVALMSRLLEVVSTEGDLIVDPFMGSGSTLVAARDSGRGCIGIEVEEKYCEAAARRLEASALSLAA